MNTKTGKHYEKKTAQVFQELNPSYVVKPNVKIKGMLSNTPRQIDILVKPSDFEQLFIECKDHHRPIDLGTFGEFMSLLDDIKQKGKAAMVSNSPYTKGVMNMAKAKQVELLHVIDTGDPKIRTQLSASTLVSDTKLKYSQFKLQTAESFSGFTNNPIVISPHFRGTVKDYFRHLWNETESLNQFTGNFEFRVPDARVIATDGTPVPFELTFHYSVEEEYYLGSIEIIDSSGLLNVADGGYTTKSMSTGPIDPNEIVKTWKRISSDEAKQTTTTFGFGIKSNIP